LSSGTFVVARDPEELRRIRVEDLGLTQEQLVDRTHDNGANGVSWPVVVRAERGRPIRRLSAAAIARALGKRFAELFVAEEAAS
jgi:predicted transcriptional regulator